MGLEFWSRRIVSFLSIHLYDKVRLVKSVVDSGIRFIVREDEDN